MQGLGHSTFSAAGVTQALALFDDPGGIDVLFTDIRLPESDLGGFELAQQVREKNPSLKDKPIYGDRLACAVTQNLDLWYFHEQGVPPLQA